MGSDNTCTYVELHVKKTHGLAAHSSSSLFPFDYLTYSIVFKSRSSGL
jgi:hypothetical protein